MAFELSLFSGALIEKQAVNEVMKCNDLTVKFGLVLTEAQALALVETRAFALKENGRIEFGGGVIDKIIKEFCNSPYLSRHNYEETMHELLGIFYYYKNETLDLMCDDDLIQYMKNAFNGICQGSFELLSGRELYKLARNLRYGYALDYSDDAIQLDDE
ncbi:DUF6323 family protein [Desulfosporosinus meridiei]|uniref:Uncharacterized protein n=1 Tax=Desulfosporosinus meridiei (strain ATCC BAA-275 / DSM 13257 / KCTC 12902 / NCIMB 13706 / S10) TaxID=768704 RepID=J7IUS5_DESMD|nr:DUF6323 family protein [Desulfosporosinus meridiei]AFQ43899.1 hypothetical protein Desmer_1947 [Desulfosporosinus meridiei DSM 13257]